MTSESAGTSDDGPNIEASERVETGCVSRWGTDLVREPRRATTRGFLRPID
jgi:hypothetical protein